MSTSSRSGAKRSSGSSPRSRSLGTRDSAPARSRTRAASSSRTPPGSSRRGGSTSSVEVTNVSPHGFWLLLDGRELFVPFEQFPWFREASIAALTRVERPHEGHLVWPDLDVDLSVESIEHPERYPLVSRLGVPRRQR
jgi:hypothetical protein